MKKLQSTLPNMVVVLTAVAVISGAVLASVNHATEAPKTFRWHGKTPYVST